MVYSGNKWKGWKVRQINEDVVSLLKPLFIAEFRFFSLLSLPSSSTATFTVSLNQICIQFNKNKFYYFHMYIH